MTFTSVIITSSENRKIEISKVYIKLGSKVESNFAEVCQNRLKIEEIEISFHKRHLPNILNIFTTVCTVQYCLEEMCSFDGGGQ